MKTATVRDKFQITLPEPLRREVPIQKNDVMTFIPWGGKAVVMVPQKLKTPELLMKSEALAQKHGITLEEMLLELDQIRHEH